MSKLSPSERALSIRELRDRIVAEYVARYGTAKFLRLSRASYSFEGPALYRRIDVGGDYGDMHKVFRLEAPARPSSGLVTKSELLRQTEILVDHGHRTCNPAHLVQGVREMHNLRALQVTATQQCCFRDSTCTLGRACVFAENLRPALFVMRNFSGRNLGGALSMYIKHLSNADTVTLVLQAEKESVQAVIGGWMRIAVRAQHVRIVFANHQGEMKGSCGGTGSPSVGAAVEFMANVAVGRASSYAFCFLHHPPQPKHLVPVTSPFADIGDLALRVRQRITEIRAARIARHNLVHPEQPLPTAPSPVLLFQSAREYVAEGRSDELDEDCLFDLKEALAGRHSYKQEEDAYPGPGHLVLGRLIDAAGLGGPRGEVYSHHPRTSDVVVERTHA